MSHVLGILAHDGSCVRNSDGSYEVDPTPFMTISYIVREDKTHIDLKNQGRPDMTAVAWDRVRMLRTGDHIFWQEEYPEVPNWLPARKYVRYGQITYIDNFGYLTCSMKTLYRGYTRHAVSVRVPFSAFLRKDYR